MRVAHSIGIPEVWVEILSVDFKEGGDMLFNPLRFEMHGLVVTTRIEVLPGAAMHRSSSSGRVEA